MLQVFAMLMVGGYFILTAGTIGAQSEPPERLLIISPAPGEVILGSTIKAIVEAPSGLPPGHVHLWLDTEPVHDSERTVVLSDTLEYTFTRVFSGLHTLHTEWTADDHAPRDVHVSEIGNPPHPARRGPPSPSGRGEGEGDARSVYVRLVASVEFETTAEELKPAPKDEGSVEAPPDIEGGYFLPRGKGNTLLTLLIVIVGAVILWILYGRKR